MYERVENSLVEVHEKLEISVKGPKRANRRRQIFKRQTSWLSDLFIYLLKCGAFTAV